ncbi:hypothetical protein ACFUOZ_21290, partial [Paenarthrobacter sp. NPDC057355]|uniref:hypothetical protein n=1 Tax=Paenarthrobacter sp. NPDC057355 TaxID=3346105 RepID=UPI00362F4FD7
MVLGLWSSAAGVGAGRVLAGRDGSGVLARILGVMLAVAVTLTLFVVVDVAAGPAANAKPPVVVPTTPPRVTDPDNVRRIGFPALPGQSPGDMPQFDAVEVYPGIWIANHNDPGGRWRTFPKWDSFDDVGVWQRNVDLITADLDRLWSTGSGKTIMKVAGTLKPTPGGERNLWIDHSGRGLPKGTANPDIGVVIFPTPGEGAAATPLSRSTTGTASYVRHDPAAVSSIRDPNSGAVIGKDPVANLGHELTHTADNKAYTNPRDGAGEHLKIETPYNVFRGGTPEAPAGLPKPYKKPLAAAEILTVGGESEMTALVKYLKAHPELSPVPLEELSITSHAWRNQAAKNALVGEARHISPEELHRINLLTEFAQVNPTEAKIGAALETGIRPSYLGATYRGPDGKSSPRPRFTRDVAAGVLTAEDLANPYQSSKLRPVAPVTVPVCGAEGGDGANESCEPDVAESEPMSEEEVKTFEEDVKTRVELEKSNTSESVFFESLSVEDLQVLAGMGVTGSPEMVRDAVRFAPEVRGGGGKGPLVEGPGGVGTPEFNEVLRSKGFAELNSRGEGPHVGGSPHVPVNEILAMYMIFTSFSEDSTVLNQAAALLATVPVVGQIFWFASAVEGGDGTNIIASGLALASAGIEAGIGLASLFGVEAGAIMAGLASLAAALGIVSLVIVGVSTFVTLVKTKGWGWISEHSSPLTWFISLFIDKSGPVEAGPADVPKLETTYDDPHGEWGGVQNGHDKWTTEYVKARMTNAYLLWADEYS